MTDRDSEDAGPGEPHHRLLGEHLLDGSLDPGEELHLRPDQVLIEDATGTMTYLQFEALGMDRVAVPLAVLPRERRTLLAGGVLG